MARKPYVVRINGDLSHIYGEGYFPRKVHYKREAIALAKRAVEIPQAGQYGATMARVEFPDGGELDFYPPKHS